MSQYHALVVDDNLQNLKVLVQLLAKQGITATEVSDPRKLKTVLPGVPQADIAFIDLEMPGLNGYEVKDQLKSHFGDIVVIAYTVHVSEMNVVKRNGFDGFIGKPINPDKFAQQVAKILEGGSVWETV